MSKDYDDREEWFCEGCGEEVEEDMEYCLECENVCDCGNECLPGKDYCADCGFAEVVNDACYTPTLQFFKHNKKEKLCLGLELEVEHCDFDELVPKIDNFKDFLYKEKTQKYFYFKEDSSLDNGFEIVSHPFTLSYGKRRMKFKKILQHLRSNGFSSEENCGLHVHLSKAFFTKEDITNLRIFFLVCKDEIYKLSQRDEVSYCKFEDEIYDLEDLLEDPEQNDRYWALNLNSNQSGTIEIRVFSGTLNEKRFMSALEFAESVSLFSKTIGKDYTNLWARYNLFLMKNKRYKTLLSTLKTDKLLKKGAEIRKCLASVAVKK
jgi:hypothetical protein